MHLGEIQQAFLDEHLDGWLFFDHHRNRPRELEAVAGRALARGQRGSRCSVPPGRFPAAALA
jgi:hypothetical protein